MKPELIVYAVFAAAVIGLALLERYHGVNAELLKKTAGLIAEAEELFSDYEACGENKMEWVIGVLKHSVPVMLGWLFPRETLREAVQEIFDSMQKFGRIGK